MISCTRRYQFCAGHRVLGHENKCANVHGHNYVVMFTAQAEDLDAIGRVIDFSVLKAKLGGWIDENWDHGFLVNVNDMELREALEGVTRNEVRITKLFICDFNPTAENMAEWLLRTMCPAQLLGTGVVVTSVRVWETENCYADAKLEEQIHSAVARQNATCSHGRQSRSVCGRCQQEDAR